MPNRKSSRRKSRVVIKQQQLRKRSYILPIALVVLLLLGLIGVTMGDSTRGSKFSALLTSPPPTPSPTPTKEYIYAGSKLIATEEPASLAAPTNLTALTVSNETPSRVVVSWTASQAAHHYEIERTTRLNVAYTPINTNATGTTFNDTTVSSVNAYLYRIRAVDATGNVSPYSNVDLATAITFTDDSIATQSTPVKTTHINQLRQAVDAVRWTANLSAANWGPSLVQFTTTVQATHIEDLRTNLTAALSALNMAPCTYTDNSVTALRNSFIKKEHIDQLRQCVK
jgi:hypothetical protein